MNVSPEELEKIVMFVLLIAITVIGFIPLDKKDKK